jgi:hypothetical protein
MPLPIPQYILRANPASDTINYEWDDWQIPRTYEPVDEELYRRLDGLSLKANIAFCAAAAEWICHRFDTLSDDPVPYLHLESIWAGVVDGRYFDYWEPPDANWMGSVRGPLSMAIIFTIEAGVQAGEDAHPSLSGARISRLAEHVLIDPQPFQKWRQRVLERLEELYPLDEEDKAGDVVPREAFDPEFGFDPGMTEALINRFLARLDWRTNRFLRSPDEMLALGFRGTPYTFNLADDRQARADW